MSTYQLNDTYFTAERYKIYTLFCKADEINEKISQLQSQGINVLNVGKELAGFIDKQHDNKYLNIEVFDQLKYFMEKKSVRIDGSINNVIAIYNLGILLEPALELNAVQFLKEFSKSCAVIIIWENQAEVPHKLYWQTQSDNILFDFSDTSYKVLQYAV